MRSLFFILNSSLKKRADTRARTGDLFITNELLYQLSHIGIPIQMWVQSYEYFFTHTNISYIFFRKFTFYI